MEICWGVRIFLHTAAKAKIIVLRGINCSPSALCQSFYLLSRRYCYWFDSTDWYKLSAHLAKISWKKEHPRDVFFVSWIYRVYRKCLDKFPHTKIRKNFIQIYVWRRFSGYIPITCWPQSFRFLPEETLKYLSVFSSNLKWRNISSRSVSFAYGPYSLTSASLKRRFIDAFFMPVTPFATALGVLKGAIFHDHMCPCVHWFRWRTF
jgi:hypothetical protein